MGDVEERLDEVEDRLERVAAEWERMEGLQESVGRSEAKTYRTVLAVSDRLREMQNEVERLGVLVQRIDDLQQEMSKRLCVQSDQIQALLRVQEKKATPSIKMSVYRGDGTDPYQKVIRVGSACLGELALQQGTQEWRKLAQEHDEVTGAIVAAIEAARAYVRSRDNVSDKDRDLVSAL